MTGYQLPRHSGKSDVEYYSYNDASQCRDAGYPKNWGQPSPVVLRPCDNPMCVRESEARYCSAYCLETIEGDLSAEPEETNGEPTITLDEFETLLTALCAESPALREYLALTLLGPEKYCEAQEAYYVAEEHTTFLGSRVVADTQYQEDESRGGLAWLACYGR